MEKQKPIIEIFVRKNGINSPRIIFASSFAETIVACRFSDWQEAAVLTAVHADPGTARLIVIVQRQNWHQPKYPVIVLLPRLGPRPFGLARFAILAHQTLQHERLFGVGQLFS